MLFWIFAIGLPILLVIILWRLLKSLARAASITLGIFFVVTLILGALVYFDAKDLSKKLQNEDSVFYLDDNGRLLAGAFNIIRSGNMTPLGAQSFASYKFPETGKEKKALLGDNSKLFIFKLQAFDSLTDQDFSDQDVFKKQFVYDLLRSDDILGIYIEHMVDAQGVPEEQMDAYKTEAMKRLPSEEQFRAALFTILMGELSRKEGNWIISVLDGYREDSIMIYPETVMFLTIKYLPESSFDAAKAFQMPKLGENVGGAE